MIFAYDIRPSSNQASVEVYVHNKAGDYGERFIFDTVHVFTVTYTLARFFKDKQLTSGLQANRDFLKILCSLFTVAKPVILW